MSHRLIEVASIPSRGDRTNPRDLTVFQLADAVSQIGLVLAAPLFTSTGLHYVPVHPSCGKVSEHSKASPLNKELSHLHEMSESAAENRCLEVDHEHSSIIEGSRRNNGTAATAPLPLDLTFSSPNNVALPTGLKLPHSSGFKPTSEPLNRENNFDSADCMTSQFLTNAFASILASSGLGGTDVDGSRAGQDNPYNLLSFLALMSASLSMNQMTTPDVTRGNGQAQGIDFAQVLASAWSQTGVGSASKSPVTGASVGLTSQASPSKNLSSVPSHPLLYGLPHSSLLHSFVNSAPTTATLTGINGDQVTTTGHPTNVTRGANKPASPPVAVTNQTIAIHRPYLCIYCQTRFQAFSTFQAHQQYYCQGRRKAMEMAGEAKVPTASSTSGLQPCAKRKRIHPPSPVPMGTLCTTAPNQHSGDDSDAIKYKSEPVTQPSVSPPPPSTKSISPISTGGHSHSDSEPTEQLNMEVKGEYTSLRCRVCGYVGQTPRGMRMHSRLHECNGGSSTREQKLAPQPNRTETLVNAMSHKRTEISTESHTSDENRFYTTSPTDNADETTGENEPLQ